MAHRFNLSILFIGFSLWCLPRLLTSSKWEATRIITRFGLNTVACIVKIIYFRINTLFRNCFVQKYSFKLNLSFVFMYRCADEWICECTQDFVSRKISYRHREKWTLLESVKLSRVGKTSLLTVGGQIIKLNIIRQQKNNTKNNKFIQTF